MQLQITDNGEAAPKRRRTKRRDYTIVRTRPETAPLWKRLTRRGLLVGEGRIEKPLPRKMQVAIESSLQDRSELLKFAPPSLRVELENFIGWNTAAGRNAKWAEQEFFRMRRAK